ncbi:MAG: DUF4231 domain-containing protein [Moorea sp. SIO1G6]|uniref:DUF4231 domain-containing protein n=1 Tax=Moorena sp. SIO1G6 TaxID=2607840 RepID=UPI0013C0D196|nr:DUF4231 domain-containing protein [Moorena sp. SIO1G6]NET68390.1 DUF4231 domain-containing protein [Moorena sp. SIO1G6]
MASKKLLTYQKQFTQRVIRLASCTNLSSHQKLILCWHWLDQVNWFNNKAIKYKNIFYSLKLVTTVSSILLPTLLGLELSGLSDDPNFVGVMFVISQLIALGLTLEEIIQSKFKYILYRKTAEDLKQEGWYFFQLTDEYKKFTSHQLAFPKFCENVDLIITDNLESYMNKVNKIDGSSVKRYESSIAARMSKLKEDK